MFKPYFGETSQGIPHGTRRFAAGIGLLLGAVAAVSFSTLRSSSIEAATPVRANVSAPLNPPVDSSSQPSGNVLVGGYGTGGVLRMNRSGESARILAAPAPTFLLAHPRLPVTYVTSEFAAGRKNLRAMRSDGTVISTVWAGGESPVRISINSEGDRLAVANYDGSVAVHALSKTGSIGRLLHRFISNSGSSRMHSAIFGPAGSNLLYATELATDKVYVFDLGPSRGELRLVQTLVMSRGSGPRQIVVAGQVAYVASELDAHVEILRRAPNGSLQALSRIPVQSSGATAELVVDPTGNWLIVLMRTPDACVVFAIAGESLTPHSTQTCGRAPRYATFGPLEKGTGVAAGSGTQTSLFTFWVAAQKSDEVLALPFDSSTGLLGKAVLVGSAKGAAGLVVER